MEIIEVLVPAITGFVGVWFGTFFTNRTARETATLTNTTALQVARETRAASDQLPALRELHEQVTEYIKAVNNAVWSVSADWRPDRDFFPFMPPPTSPDDPIPRYSTEAMIQKLAYEAWHKSYLIANDLGRLKEFIANEAIRTEVAALISTEWIDNAVADRDATIKELRDCRDKLDAMIGHEYRSHLAPEATTQGRALSPPA